MITNFGDCHFAAIVLLHATAIVLLHANRLCKIVHNLKSQKPVCCATRNAAKKPCLPLSSGYARLVL